MKDFLRERELLLVLDNFEQLVSAAPLVAELLAGSPRLRIVVTSRAVSCTIKVLGPEAIVDRLERRLPVLASGGQDLPARQRTLWGAIDWSYGLLDEAERRLFARLAVFVGGWTLEAADEVCNPVGRLRAP